jgi:hypothetical protein
VGILHFVVLHHNLLHQVAIFGCFCSLPFLFFLRLKGSNFGRTFKKWDSFFPLFILLALDILTLFKGIIIIGELYVFGLHKVMLVAILHGIEFELFDCLFRLDRKIIYVDI